VEEEGARRQKGKTKVAVAIAVPVALLHFVTGPGYRGPWPDFVNGYLIDIMLPFSVYFLLAPQDAVYPMLRPWWVKALPVFAIGVTVETAQYLGIHLLGETFDPLDFVAYGAGVALAALVDTQIFAGVFEFWKPRAA
jgi:hypothetical protein